jgi:hypothetical protein
MRQTAASVPRRNSVFRVILEKKPRQATSKNLGNNTYQRVNVSKKCLYAFYSMANRFTITTPPSGCTSIMLGMLCKAVTK